MQMAEKYLSAAVPQQTAYKGHLTDMSLTRDIHLFQHQMRSLRVAEEVELSCRCNVAFMG